MPSWLRFGRGAARRGRLVYGVEWELFDTDRALIKARRSLPISARSVAVSTAENKLLGRFEKNDRSGFSAAALLARHVENGVAVEQIGANSYWVCAVRDGVPLPGEDRIVDSKDVALLNANDHLNNMPTAVRVGLIPDAEKSLDKILLANPGIDWTTFELTAWRAVRLRRTLAAVGIVVGAVGFAVFLQRAADQVVQQQAAPEQQVVIQTQPAQSAVIAPPPLPQELMVPAYTPSQAFKLLTLAVNEIESSVGGWSPASVECTLASATCDVTWQPGYGATAKSAGEIPGLITGTPERLAGAAIVSRHQFDSVATTKRSFATEANLLELQSTTQQMQLLDVAARVSIRRDGSNYAADLSAPYSIASDFARMVGASNAYASKVRLEGISGPAPTVLMTAALTVEQAAAAAVPGVAK